MHALNNTGVSVTFCMFDNHLGLDTPSAQDEVLADADQGVRRDRQADHLPGHMEDNHHHDSIMMRLMSRRRTMILIWMRKRRTMMLKRRIFGMTFLSPCVLVFVLVCVLVLVLVCFHLVCFSIFFWSNRLWS